MRPPLAAAGGRKRLRYLLDRTCLPTGFVWQITDFFCAVPTMLNIICVLSLSGVYFKLVKDYKARYMGIGKIDPNFKPFFEDEVKK